MLLNMDPEIYNAVLLGLTSWLGCIGSIGVALLLFRVYFVVTGTHNLEARNVISGYGSGCVGMAGGIMTPGIIATLLGYSEFQIGIAFLAGAILLFGVPMFFGGVANLWDKPRNTKQPLSR